MYDSYGTSGWLVFGGTSVSSPILASVYALAGNASTVTAQSLYGAALHAAVSEFHKRHARGELMSEEALVAAFRAAWTSEGFLSREHEEARRAAGRDVAALAAQFHESVAAATAVLAERACAACGTDTVALGGGVFQNARLLESVARRLRAHRLTALVPRRLPPNDGAVSYGQAVVAAARLAREGM